ncbi:MAG: CoA transferase [Rubrivivax sp.]|nr:CoA transferase [Rubrivivax sp.]
MPRNAAPAPAGAVLEDLWRALDLPSAALERVEFTGHEPALPCSFAVGTALQAAVGAAALGAAVVGAARAGAEVGAARAGAGSHGPRVQVAMADVIAECAGRFALDGRVPDPWDKLSGLYRCGADDTGWVRVHANFAHHRDAVLRLLGLPAGPGTERAALAAALRGRKAEDFETAATAHGGVVAAVRDPAAWQAHPQAAAVAALPLVDLQPLGAAPARPWPATTGTPTGTQPLQGLRVLDLTRVLAGPVAGRTLAAYGAEVMLVNGPGLPNIENIADTSRGKLSAHIDLRSAAGRDTLRDLVRSCDVFLQGYRPGALEALGFGPAALAALRPGIVCVSLSAYGHEGPWSARRGFDSLVQSATGLNVLEAAAFGQAEPRALPLQALDYGAAFLLAFGASAALLRQRQHGGSWLVRVALARVGHWLQGLGRVAGGPLAPKPDLDGALEEEPSGFGALRAAPHAARFDGARCRWRRPSMPPGTHAAQWPAR